MKIPNAAKDTDKRNHSQNSCGNIKMLHYPEKNSLNKQVIIRCSSNYTPGHLFQRNKKTLMFIQKSVYERYSSFVNNGLKQETTQMSFN